MKTLAEQLWEYAHTFPYGTLEHSDAMDEYRIERNRVCFSGSYLSVS